MTVSYDKLPMLFQSELDIPMYEAVGAAGAFTHDIARPPGVALDHTMTLVGATIAWAQWPLSNLTVMSFTPGTPDYLQLAAAQSTDMNYVAGAFSGMIWAFFDDLTNHRWLIERGLLNTDGWEFWVDLTGTIRFITNQGGAGQVSTSAAAAITTASWWCLGFTRLGASVRLYRNGVDVTNVVGVHVNPTGNAARNLRVGADDGLAATMDGYLWRPIVVHRQMTALDMWKYFEMTRGLFGV